MECPICLEETTIPYQTKCNHQYCYPCLTKLFTRGVKSCSYCRAELQRGDCEPALNKKEYYRLLLQCDKEIAQQMEINCDLREMMDYFNRQVCSDWFKQSKAFQIYYHFNFTKWLSKTQQLEFDIMRNFSDDSHIFNRYRGQTLFSSLLAPTIKALGLEQNQIDLYNSQILQKQFRIKVVGCDPLKTIITLTDDTTMNLLQYHIACNNGIILEKRLNRETCEILAQAWLSVEYGLKNEVKGIEMLMETEFPKHTIQEKITEMRQKLQGLWYNEYDLWSVQSFIKRYQTIKKKKAKAEMTRQFALDWSDIQELLTVILNDSERYHVIADEECYYYVY